MTTSRFTSLGVLRSLLSGAWIKAASLGNLLKTRSENLDRFVTTRVIPNFHRFLESQSGSFGKDTLEVLDTLK